MLVYQRVNDMFPKSQPNCVSLPVVPFESPRLPHSSPTGRRSAAEWHQIHVSDQPNAESNGDDLIGRRPGDIVWTAKRSTSYLKDPKILERSDAKNGYIKYLHIYIYIVYYIYILYIYIVYIYIHFGVVNPSIIYPLAISPWYQRHYPWVLSHNPSISPVYIQ